MRGPIKKDEETCRTCRHYESYVDRVQDDHGGCHRYAPHPQLTENETQQEVLYANWPWVGAGERCGEWEWDDSLDSWIDNPNENP